jgi:hypothetical protein
MVRPHITKRLFNRRRRGWRFIRRCLLGWRHRADDAVGPLKNDPINRCDRATARVDHDAHLNVAVIEDAQHIHRSLFLGFCQRKVSGSAHNCVDSVGRQKNRQSTPFLVGRWFGGWRLGEACDRYEEKAESQRRGLVPSQLTSPLHTTHRALGARGGLDHRATPNVAKRSYSGFLRQKHVIRKGTL